MIGVFDSGFGGLLVLKELDRQLPLYSFTYFGDNANAPYGNKTTDEVYELVRNAVEYLFNHGCDLVILACNSASAQALRRLQQEVLPQKYPDKRVLGILVPTVEQVTGMPWEFETLSEASKRHNKIAIFATVTTVNSRSYVKEIQKRDPNAKVFQIPCQNLAPWIETGAIEEKLRGEVVRHVDELKEIMGEQWPPDSVLLGCTHYPIVQHLFEEAMPGIHVYDQADIVAESLRDYLKRHPDMDARLEKDGQRIFLTTADPAQTGKDALRFYEKKTAYQAIETTVAPA